MRTDHFINILPGMEPLRTRTFSSDSGCDVHLDPLDHHLSSLESTVKVWQARLVGVVKQEVNRAEEVTHWATEALKHCNQDDGRREKILERWKSQMKNVLEFTNDLVECVNNDTKELIIGTADRFHELDNSIEEEEENEEEGRNIEKLLVLPSFGLKDNGLQKDRNLSSVTTLDRNCPDMKSISNDLAFLENDNIYDFDNWKLELEDIEFEDIKEEEGHQPFLKKSHYWDEKDSTDSLMILLLDEEAAKEKSAKLKPLSVHPQSYQDLDVIFVSPGKEKDSLTNWNVWDKFGETWDNDCNNSGDEDVKISKTLKVINIQEVFWRITLSLGVSRKEPSHLSVIRNLPVWDSPDIFLDSSDKVAIKKQVVDTVKDPINIFKSIRHIFNEPSKNIRQTKCTYYQKSLEDSLTNWNKLHKFGHHWDSAVVEDNSEAALDKKNVCIVKMFWKICLDEKLSRREPSHSSVIFNLPVRYWPDVMTYDWKMSGAGGGKYYKNAPMDPVSIFKSFRHIFCEPEAEDWMHCEKSGKQWEFSDDHEQTLDFVSKERKNTTSGVDVMEVFWKISLDESCCTKDEKLSEVIKHFPVWFGPDVFEDSWDFMDISFTQKNKVLNQSKSKPKDPVNIFKPFRKVFSEFVNHQKKEKDELKLNSFISEEEDIFQDWFVNVVHARKVKRNMQPEKTYFTKMRPIMGKKLRNDPDNEMARKEQELLNLLENWRI